jgi:hypothetical protein
MPFPAPESGFFKNVARQIARPFLPWIVPVYMRKIVREDNEICERIQTVAHQIDRFPRLAAHEERIAWFEESYTAALEPAISPRAVRAGSGRLDAGDGQALVSPDGIEPSTP